MRKARYPQEIKTVHGDALLLGISPDGKEVLVSLKSTDGKKGAFYNEFIPISDILTSEDGE